MPAPLVFPWRRVVIIALGLTLLAGSARAADSDEMRAEQFKARPPAEKQGTPRQTIETLCYAMDVYDEHKSMIDDAVACLDLDPNDGYMPETRSLLALQLNEILDELSFPFESCTAGGDGQPVTFYEDKDLRIVLVRGEDKLWRFDRTTVRNIFKMRLAMIPRTKARNATRASLRAELEDPTATMMSFLKYAAKGDFDSAAQRLDLSHLSRDEQRARGTLLAQKLANVIQRRGYVFSESVPVDPDGPPYTWSADSGGRIMVQRTHQPGGADSWLFARATVDAIEALYERDKDKLVDPRYLVLKTAVPLPSGAAADSATGPGHAPPTVPPQFSSARTMVLEFFRMMDEAEYDDGKLTEASRFLDLSHVPAGDVATIGPKLATMLEMVFRKLHPDLTSLSDKWSAPPQVIAGTGNLRIEIVRQEQDGCWRFSNDTAARLPAMYQSISGQEKAGHERLQGLSSPRETLVTFFRAVNAGDSDRAYGCLDLTDMPISARDNLGPVLAFKLKAVIDRTGRIYLQQIPNEPDGPRLTLYRGPLGRIVLGKRDDDPTKAWRFTAHTVQQIEDMFDRALDQPVAPALVGASHIRVEPYFAKEPGVWFRVHMPPALRHVALGLYLYQWPGLLAIFLLAGLAAFVASRIIRAVLRRLFPPREGETNADLGCLGIGSFTFLIFVLALYHLIEWVDLPSSVAAQIFSIEKLVNTMALVWAGWQLTDLGRLYHERHLRSETARGLGELVVPFVTRLIKLFIFLAGVTYLVYEFGQGDTLKQFLAGLGIAGLAVSLAAQDSLKNLFATMLLIGDRSFRVGDKLVIGNQEGVVEQLGFRSTKLRTPEDSLITMPNSVLAQGIIDNLGLRTLRRVRVNLVVPAETPTERVSALVTGLREHVAARPSADPKRAGVTVAGIKDGGIALEVAAFCDSADAEKLCREELTLEIARRACELEIRLSREPRPGA